MELGYRTIADVADNCFVWENAHHTFCNPKCREESVSVSSKGDAQVKEKHGRKK